MKKIFLSIIATSLFISCKKDSQNDGENINESYNKGITTMYVEASIVPIAEDINQVFKSYYSDAAIEVKMLSENEILNALYKDNGRLAILPKEFTQKELDVFKGRVVPKITPIAKDAILFIANKSTKDTLVNYQEVLDVFKGSAQSEKIYVFHDPNSALVNKLKVDANVAQAGSNVYFVQTVEEIIAYMNKNVNAIGVVGINWMVQPNEVIKNAIKNLRSLYVYNDSLKTYIAPSQSTIADNSYPLIRTINIIDVQGKTGLGTGFATFAASDKGQRIVLKSGLMPVKMPTREINIVE